MKTWVQGFVLFFSFLLMLVACSKDSDGDVVIDPNDDIEDPRFLGSMEAKINGQLKVWGTAVPFIPVDCGLFDCASPDCFRQFQSGGVGEPDSVYIGILFDITDPERYGCDIEMHYVVTDYSVPDSLRYYSTRNICEDDDPSTPRYICNDWSFNITPSGNNRYRGTFEFVATRNCGQDSVVITEGKFEISSKKPPCN